MPEKLFHETIVSFHQAAQCIHVLTNDMRKLLSTQSELQNHIDQIVEKSKVDQSLNDDFIFDDKEINEPNSSEHQLEELEEPLITTDKDIKNNALDDELVAEDPTNSTDNLKVSSIDNLQEYMINKNLHDNETVIHELNQITDKDKVTFEKIENEPKHSHTVYDN